MNNIIPVVDIAAINANVSAPSGKDYKGKNGHYSRVETERGKFENCVLSLLDVGRAIHDAFSEIGFVFVTNHGVPSDTVRDLFASSKKFFELDREVKEKCPMTMMGGRACQVEDLDLRSFSSHKTKRSTYDLLSVL